MNLFELRAQRDHALTKADSIIQAAESAKRPLTADEQREVDTCLTATKALSPRIKEIESKNTITKMFPNGAVILDGGRRHTIQKRVQLSAEYQDAFFAHIATGGKGPQSPALAEGFDSIGGGYALPGYQNPKAAAVLYEGSSGAGGYAVPVTVDDQIVPLAPQEMSVRRLAQVIPTIMDVKIPVKASFGTATAKAETSAFTESEPTLSQITLSAYMAGVLQEISWELAQDVPAFQAFAVDDMILAQQMYEENLYINGTGTGQAQGMIGNVGNGGTYEPDTNGNLVSNAGLLAIQGKLNAIYHPNASWLMSRATSIIVRNAQLQSNLFYPTFTRDADGTERLFGYPVQFTTYMPTAARGASPVLFGDFKRGYVIGDRGGSGINVKVLDQPLATQGILQLLAYRRTDGRVRRSEAIMQYNIAAS